MAGDGRKHRARRPPRRPRHGRPHGDPLAPWCPRVDDNRSRPGDRLTHTPFIQRTATTGGLRPAAEQCNSDTVGATVEVPYTAATPLNPLPAVPPPKAG